MNCSLIYIIPNATIKISSKLLSLIWKCHNTLNIENVSWFGWQCTNGGVEYIDSKRVLECNKIAAYPIHFSQTIRSVAHYKRALEMVDSVTKVSGSCQIYRSVEIRPRILLRADSVPSTYSSSNPSKYHVPNRDAGERVFNVSWTLWDIVWSNASNECQISQTFSTIFNADYEWYQNMSAKYIPDEKFHNMRWILQQWNGDDPNKFRWWLGYCFGRCNRENGERCSRYSQSYWCKRMHHQSVCRLSDDQKWTADLEPISP